MQQAAFDDKSLAPTSSKRCVTNDPTNKTDRSTCRDHQLTINPRRRTPTMPKLALASVIRLHSTAMTSDNDRSSLTRFAWLSICAAVVTIGLKLVAYRLTCSVGLLAAPPESPQAIRIFLPTTAALALQLIALVML
jgi:hypothetical protein